MPNRDELLYLNCELKIANAERLVRNSQRSQLATTPFAITTVRNSKSSQLATTQFATPKSSQLATQKVGNSQLIRSQIILFTKGYFST